MPAKNVSLSLVETAATKSKRNISKGVPQGRKLAFAPESVARIKSHLVAHNDRRGQALLLASLDTSLRSSDLLALRVSDVCDHNGQVVDRFDVMQTKTRRTVRCSISPATREAIAVLISAQHKLADDFLFTAKDDFHGHHITRVMYRRIVKAWAIIANLDPRRFSGHSTRRTKPTLLYTRTKDVRACAQLLGHQNLTHTLVYLAADTSAALDLADTVTF
jgi:integrase